MPIKLAIIGGLSCRETKDSEKRRGLVRLWLKTEESLFGYGPKLSWKLDHTQKEEIGEELLLRSRGESFGY
jgi:hypothetical protein